MEAVIFAGVQESERMTHAAARAAIARGALRGQAVGCDRQHEFARDRANARMPKTGTPKTKGRRWEGNSNGYLKASGASTLGGGQNL